MSIDHRAQVDELLADYRRSREQLAAVHRALSAVSASATSPDGLVTATVGAHGRLTDLVIAQGAYERHNPAELARLVLRTTTAAAERVAEQANKTVEPVLPPGTDPAALLAGRADLTPEEVAPPASEVDEDDSFENRSWLDNRDEAGTGR